MSSSALGVLPVKPRPAVRPSPSERASSPFRMEMLRIGAQLLRVGHQRGSGDGPPLLLFNGIGANLELAGALMAGLDTVETLIFDVPGAGKSPPPRFPYRLLSMARLTRKLLDALGYGVVDVMVSTSSAN